MDSILFTKMSGAGNDFIVIDKNLNPDFVLTDIVVRKLCNRRNGIGADGIILIEDSPEYDFEMNYYNADGSFGSLCGNGARCAIKFADLTSRITNSVTKFKANKFDYTGQVLENDLILFNLKAPQKIKYDFKIFSYGQLINACFADTGSPHVVIYVEDILKDLKNPKVFFQSLDEVPVIEIGRQIRYSPDFAPAGTNVNFIKVVQNKVFVRTYERGVEDETWACGTGSVAAALISFVKSCLKPPVTIVTRSGEELVVNFQLENQKVKNLSLTGPAKIIFTGQIPINFFC